LLIFGGFTSVSKSQPIWAHDSLLYAQILNTSIKKIIYASDSNLFIIAGSQSQKLYRINEKGNIDNISDKHNLPDSCIYSDVVFLGHNRFLVGTLNNYAYIVTNKKALWLNNKYGLSEKDIVSFNFDKRQKLIEANTSQKRFLLKNETKIRNIHFVEIKDTVSTFDEIVYYFRQHIQKRFQREVLEIIGDVDFSFRKNKYLGLQEMYKLKTHLLPGDIILRRNELILTNVGIPGFWTHSGIFVGQPMVLDNFFVGIEMLNGQLPSVYIAENYPEVFEKLLTQQFPVIEAIAEGVVVLPVEHIANADYLAVLRTGLDKEDIFKSLLTSFEYYGYDYDFLFDFSNDNELVCSEMAYYAFREHHDKKGINFTMGLLDGKPFLSPNDIAKQYCLELKGKVQQLELVYFFNAANKHNSRSKTTQKPKPFSEDISNFCKTWRKKIK